MSTPIWEQLITQHFNKPFYYHGALTLSEMLAVCFREIAEGLKSKACHVYWDETIEPMDLVVERYVFLHGMVINGVFYSEWRGFRINVQELQKYLGIAPSDGQSAQEFIQQHFGEF